MQWEEREQPSAEPSITRADSSRTHVKMSSMIPPTSSLVKYDNPVLVSKNTDKRSKVSCCPQEGIPGEDHLPPRRPAHPSPHRSRQ